MNNNDACQYEVMPENPVLARAYVPYQCWEETFNTEKSLMKGTAFPGLYKPYCIDNTGCLKSKAGGNSNE